jgi:tetratricopeptide (TPR) repeat protein
MNILKLAMLVGLLLNAQSVFSDSKFSDSPKTEIDFAMLPPYCKARASEEPSKSYQHWLSRLGTDFVHINHYCNGLHIIAQSTRLFNKAEQNLLLNRAIQEMSYVEQHASSGFSLLPKISYDIGQLYEKMDKTVEAMQAYRYSIKLNPNLPIPYAALSDLFKKQKDDKMARSILEQGLEHKPSSKALLKRMEKFSHNETTKQKD